MSTAAVDPAAHFVAKWQRREPEMALAEVFCPPAQRPRFRAWGALLHELRDAAFELSDARVTAVKCQWWAEELVAMAGGAGRHPLAEALVPPGLPTLPLARALLEQAQFDARPASAELAIAQLLPLASALADVEAALFECEPAPAEALAVHWLLHRLPQGLVAADQARLPLNLLARHGLTTAQVAAGEGGPLLRDWAQALKDASPAPGPGSLFRRMRSGFDRARLDRLAAGRGFGAPPAPLNLWRAWRLARAG